MTKDEILALAKYYGTRYVNRHIPDDASYGFMQKNLLEFAKAITGAIPVPIAALPDLQAKVQEGLDNGSLSIQGSLNKELYAK